MIGVKCIALWGEPNRTADPVRADGVQEEDYMVKLGRWRKLTATLLNDKHFLFEVGSSVVCHGPLN